MSLNYGWLDRTADDGPSVGLVVQAAYHLDEFVPLRDELRRRGVAADLLAPLPPTTSLGRLRPGVRRYRELLAASDAPMGPTATEEDLATDLRSVVVMNDWGLPASLVGRVAALGRPTFGWIEGVQDFDDVDTGRSRRPYRHVDHVFALGRYGEARLDGCSVTITGSSRLRDLWFADPGSWSTPHATVNSNFTYGVLTEHRRAWVASVASACRSAGMSWSLSRHTAERGTSAPHRSDRRPISELLSSSSHFVGRFSTVCYEALVRGLEVAYHNPHGEAEPTFSAPNGAFALTTNSEELGAVLSGQPRQRSEVRAAATDFLTHHLRLDPGPSPAELAADEIVSRLR